MRSRSLVALSKRYWALRVGYLPRNFSKTGDYGADQYTRAIAFRVLMHAEFETYLENLALHTLQLLADRMARGEHGKGNVALVTMFRPEKMHGMPTQIVEFKAESFLLRTHKACEHELRRKISDNKGIRAPNVLGMFIPLGIDETAISEELLIDLTTYGAQRGDVAHKALTSITNLPDPKEEKQIVERIIKGIESLEEELTKV